MSKNEELREAIGVACLMFTRASRAMGDVAASLGKVANALREEEPEEEKEPATLFGSRDKRLNLVKVAIATNRCPFCNQLGIQQDVATENYYCAECKVVFDSNGKKTAKLL